MFMALVIGGACIVIRAKADHGRNAISRAYQHVQMPQPLHLLSQKWDDRQTLDPAINSAWEYTYNMQDGQTPSQAMQDLEKTLKAQGYTTSGRFSSPSSDQYNFEMKNKKLELSILVGYTSSAWSGSTAGGNQVLITAERPE